jgi:hypothetical protein
MNSADPIPLSRIPRFDAERSLASFAHQSSTIFHCEAVTDCRIGTVALATFIEIALGHQLFRTIGSGAVALLERVRLTV